MINPYGLSISIAIFVSIKVAEKIIEKENEDILWGLSLWAIVIGIISARLYHVLDYFDLYFKSPVKIFYIWDGGLGILGAILGGAIGISAYLKLRGKKILPWLDLISVVMPLGQSIGRWGNFFNKEIFGKPTTLPWGIYISPEKRPLMFFQNEKFHPLFIYESILNLILFIILYRTYRKNRNELKSGFFISLYLIGYSVIRFALEFLRIDPWTIKMTSNLILNTAQTISILLKSFSKIAGIIIILLILIFFEFF